MERAKTEGIVDIFQFIRRARIQRAGLVRNEVQSNATVENTVQMSL